MRRIVPALLLLPACFGGDLTLPGGAEPAAIRIVDGDDQRARAGAVLDEPLVVQVLDAGGRPVAGAPVEFGFVGGIPGAELDPPTATTGADGRAAAIARLGIVSGEQTIVARVLGADAEPDVRFTATAVGKDKEKDTWGEDDEDEDD